VEDRVRKVGVRRRIVHARVDPAWANSGHPSPLPVPLRGRLSGSSMSGTARVPAPQRKSRAIRRVRESPRCRVSASASANLLSMLAQQTGHPPEFSSSLYTYLLPPVKPQGVSFLTVPTLPHVREAFVAPSPVHPTLPLLRREGEAVGPPAQGRCRTILAPPPSRRRESVDSTHRFMTSPVSPSRRRSHGGNTQLKGEPPAKAGAVLAEAADLPYNACNLTEWTR
jgi:hypothetical protein